MMIMMLRVISVFLFRASCFKVTKRDGDSSLMQLKEEFRTYEVGTIYQSDA